MTTSTRTPLGVTLVDGGANVALFSEHRRAGRVLHASTTTAPSTAPSSATAPATPSTTSSPGVAVGTRYGFRVHGAWDPANGLRHNGAQARCSTPTPPRSTASTSGARRCFGHDMDEPEQIDETDSATRDAASRSSPTAPSTGTATPCRGTPLADTVVYEVHVKGFTKQHPDVPEEIRGTYAGMAHPAAIKHLIDLGVTAVELLPDAPVRAGLDARSTRGCATTGATTAIGFFAPHDEYSSAGTAGQQVAEFKEMVKALHAAGLEVIMDVVYNHTAEGNHMGPTLSFKGIDNAVVLPARRG